LRLLFAALRYQIRYFKSREA